MESSTASSCVVEAEESVDDDDRHHLCLLDSLHQLLCSRDLLASSLSQGWMEMASARYSMGPSRISQALLSLKPCTTSTQVSVSTTELVVEAEDGEVLQDNTGETDKNFGVNSSLKFQLIYGGSKNINSSSREEPSLDRPLLSNLRHRHTTGLRNGQHLLDDLDDSVQDLSPFQRDTPDVNSFQSSEPLAWFGTLVSPHLRTAQSSFTKAVEIIVELATLQSKIIAAYHQIQHDRDSVASALPP